ncbi:hypothetical protein [Nocardioides sp. KR10-350]|uniref:hypothetical protein n=1 Tax=Nocardioides cheoyonin TaxID=3156615 RepID=UPI0032B5280B
MVSSLSSLLRSISLRPLRTLRPLALVLPALLAFGPLAPGAADAPRRIVAAPPPATIVRITGTAADGFGIKHYDGSWDYPPTTSEALAECEGYDTRVDTVRCRVQTRVWYRDLGRTKRAIDWARHRP